MLALIVALAGLVRFLLAARGGHAGDGDPAFYYAVAENIAGGRGWVPESEHKAFPDQSSRTLWTSS